MLITKKFIIIVNIYNKRDKWTNHLSLFTFIINSEKDFLCKIKKTYRSIVKKLKNIYCTNTKTPEQKDLLKRLIVQII